MSEIINPTWDDLVLGKEIVNTFDAKKYEVIRVEENDCPPYVVYVAHLDGEDSQVKCLYTRPHLFQWVFTHKQAIQIQADQAKSKAKFLKEWVKTL